MTSFAQSFVIKIRRKLNLFCQIEQVFPTARSHQFLQRKGDELFLSSNVSELECFVDKGFVKTKGNFHGQPPAK